MPALKTLSNKARTFEINIGNNGDKKTFLIKHIKMPDQIDGRKALISYTDISSLIKEEQKLKETIEKLRKQSLVDELTGLYNRRCLLKTLFKEIHRCKRYNSNLSLIILDIDLFKAINDENGHIFGDYILRSVADIINKNCRNSDYVFRYGGDEFIILLPNTFYDGALNFADKIVEKIKQKKFSKNSKSAMVTLSMGISSFNEDDPEDEEGFIDFADKALLRAKKMGGSSILCYKDIKGRKEIVEKNRKEEILKKGDFKIVQPIITLLKALEVRDPYSKGHSLNVMNIAVKIAREMGLDKKTINKIRDAAIVHDIGKIGISDNILLKKGKLDESERREIQKHPLLGIKMLRHIKELEGLKPIVLYHHEWYNGNGYPDGIKKDEIPIEARIIAVADSFDAMVSPRPYREAMDIEKVIEEFIRFSGIQFFPDIVSSFFKVLKDNYKETTKILTNKLI